MMYKPYLSSLLIIFVLLSATITNSAEQMHVKFLGGIEGRSDYEFALLKLAMSKNRNIYGEAVLSRLDEQLGAARGRREVERGERVNVLSSPVTRSIYLNDQKIIVVPVPILNGLLGYRRIAVRQQDVDKYQTIARNKNEQAFKALVAGQGRAWFDIEIYKGNGYQVVGIGHFDGLFHLLHRKRFDYLPLSVVEMRNALALFSNEFPNLVEVDNLMLHYPLPVFYQVSAKQVKLAQRLEEGLRISMQDGSFVHLLKQFYSDEIEQIINPNTCVFHLQNSFLPPSLQHLKMQDLR